MAPSPHKLYQFWQELKRRKVTRTITVYAAAAFVILELLSIIIEPLRLPEWTLQFAIVFLCIGFIIAVILSWIYDAHPEGGIVKTEPSKKVMEESVRPSSRGWKIASYISFVVIVGLIVLNVIPKSDNFKKKSTLDKSIAVLPFHNDSPDKENEYFINGTMESILNNLCKIKELRVVSRSSVEQYRDSVVYIPDVARKMMVSYILEGSMQKVGDRIRMTLQLIDMNDSHIWAEQYDREISRAEEIFSLQSEIAQLVAGEINAVITPKEEQLIEKIPTFNQAAYDLQARGRMEYEKYLYSDDLEAIDRAESYFRIALDYDSTYALCYVWLAGIRIMTAWQQSQNPSVQYWDSCFNLIDIALDYDDELPEAYIHKGLLYIFTGQPEKAFIEFDNAIKYDPNYYSGYLQRAVWQMNYSYNLVASITNWTLANKLDFGPQRTAGLTSAANVLFWAGFPKEGTQILKEIFNYGGDSASYYFNLGLNEHYQGNYKEAQAWFQNSYQSDSTRTDVLVRLGENCLFQRRFNESLEYFRKYLERTEESALDWFQIQNIGYAFQVNGFEEEADYYLNMHIDKCNYLNEERISASATCGWTYHWLAACYAAFGEIDKVNENLRIATKMDRLPLWMLNDLQNNPIYDNVRGDSDFQEILRDVEAKYQAEHERVHQWLEENDLL